ncbi:MAG: protease family protein [Acidobacteriota bacterium]|jgi:membrane protease YdiL (CAAX protease family)|nr:protease family protein [Acidobacteriota bacterium]
MLFGWLHILFFGLFVPVVALRTRSAVLRMTAPPNRIVFYSGALIQLVLFTAISIFVAAKENIELFPHRAPTAIQALIGLIALIVLVAFLRPRWKQSVLSGEKVIALFMPATRDERLLWLLVSLLAGFSEEITWRGVQTALLDRVTGALVFGILFSAVMFGAAHAVQGYEGVALIGTIALVFHGLVLITGSLYVAMAVHFLYDAIAGLTYAKFAREYGYSFPATTNTFVDDTKNFV